MKRLLYRCIKGLAGCILITAVSFTGFSTLPSGGDREAIAWRHDTKATSGIGVSKANLPLYFIPNQGQADSRALFTANARNYRIWITRTGLLFDIMGTQETDAPATKSPEGFVREAAGKRLGHVSAVRFPGADPYVPVEATDFADYTVHYITGKNAADWRTGIRASETVIYKDLYPLIDLKLYGKGSRFEYDWIVKPGGSPEKIRIAFDGVEGVVLNEDGNLCVLTEINTFIHEKPAAYQIIDGEKRAVEASFRITSENTAGFDLGVYDRDYGLVIDPLVFVYATFLGGSELEEAHDIDTDQDGRAVITGDTASSDFPSTLGTYDPVLNGGRDIFVTKFNAPGTGLLYSTYIGGANEDRGFGIYVDSQGAAFIAGSTRSGDFPTTAGVYDRSINGESDAVVVKLNKSGSALLLSTFLGGSAEDSGYGITLDETGAIYITGATESGNFPTTPGADDRTFGGHTDAFAAKMDAAASALLYATYVGDEAIEECFDIITDGTGAAYVTGFKDQGADTDADVLAVKINRQGAAQVYSFVFGGSGDESGRGITVDGTGAAYIVGWTESADFPTTPGAFDRTQNGHTDAFVSKLKPAGSGFVYSTYLGGNCWDYGEDIDLYDNLSAIVTGYTTAGDFPVTPNAFDRTHNGKLDAFVTRFDPAGSGLEYSTFVGGADSDLGMGIALDAGETAHVTGYTSSPDFPVTPDAYGRTFGPASDAFYVKFALEWPIAVAIVHPSNEAAVAGIIAVDTEVTASGTVAEVKYSLDGAHIHTRYGAPYGFTWDTTVLANGPHKLRAWAADEDGYAAFHEISVTVLNGTLGLQMERGLLKTWLFEKPYAELKLSVLSSQTLSAADWYAFFRKSVGESYSQVRAFQRSELEGNTLVFRDMPLDAEKAYSYYVVAVTEEGEFVGVSSEVTK